MFTRLAILFAKTANMRANATLLKLVLAGSLIVNVYLYVELYLFETNEAPTPIAAKQVAIINAVRYHNEVWYSYLYAAAIRCRWRVALYTVFHPPKFGDENGYAYVTRSWSRPLLSPPPQHVEQLFRKDANICSFDIIIVCTLKHSQLQRVLSTLLNECDKRITRLLLLQLHQAKLDLPEFEKIFGAFASLQSQKRVQVRYLALAEHVKRFAEQHMTLRFPVDIWRPGHPLDLPTPVEDDQFHPYFDFAIQGKLDDTRRDYSRLAADIQRHQATLQQHKIVFTIVGIAKTISRHKYLHLPNVRLFLPPHYLPADVYYSLLRQAVGLIPTFGTDDYFLDTQSSSIFCSILTQTPLLATQRLIDTHTFIPLDAVWLQRDNETDVDAIVRITRGFASASAFRRALFSKRQKLGQLLKRAYKDNEKTLTGYVRLLE